MLMPSEWNPVLTDLGGCYRYSGKTRSAAADDEDMQWVQQLLLSPRASYFNRPRATYSEHEDRCYAEGFSVCASCKCSLQQHQMPKFAIANNYCFGTPPQCLIELTDVELAMLTPVKTYGYCFSYTGGPQKQLKGSLSYYKVNIDSIVRSVTHFDVLGLSNNVVVLLYGTLTPEQRRKVAKKNKIRTAKVLSALQWLLLNNEEWQWQNINLDEVRNNLRNPILVDKSRTQDGAMNEESNIESTESFQVFFPDGTMSPLTGGQDDLQKFQELVQAA